MQIGKLRITKHGVMFWCQGCKMYHVVNLDSEYSPIVWDFNWDYDKPTFQPSILVQYPWGEDRKMVTCHCFVTDGKVQYLDDSTHEFAGQTVDLAIDSEVG